MTLWLEDIDPVVRTEKLVIKSEVPQESIRYNIVYGACVVMYLCRCL